MEDRLVARNMAVTVGAIALVAIGLVFISMTIGG
jgi:cell division septation protein DedD